MFEWRNEVEVSFGRPRRIKAQKIENPVFVWNGEEQTSPLPRYSKYYIDPYSISIEGSSLVQQTNGSGFYEK
jgi:hypothetical protein